MTELRTTLHPDESVIKDGQVDLSLRVLRAHGQLYLTNMRLIFEALGSDAQKEDLDVPLEAISGLGKRWQKLGPVPLMPNALLVTTRGGDEWEIVTFGRSGWITAIEKAKSQPA